MTNEPTQRRKYRVLYAVTRGEYYEIEAATAEEAAEKAFSDGTLVDTGETTDVVDCAVEEIAAFSASQA